MRRIDGIACFVAASMILAGCNADVLPPIPTTGWTQTAGRWHQPSMEIADTNSDGRLDYVRMQDPALSYNHRIWIDQDLDGYFDRYTDAGKERKVRIRSPEFKPQS